MRQQKFRDLLQVIDKSQKELYRFYINAACGRDHAAITSRNGCLKRGRNLDVIHGLNFNNGTYWLKAAILSATWQKRSYYKNSWLWFYRIWHDEMPITSSSHCRSMNKIWRNQSFSCAILVLSDWMQSRENCTLNHGYDKWENYSFHTCSKSWVDLRNFSHIRPS